MLCSNRTLISESAKRRKSEGRVQGYNAALVFGQPKLYLCYTPFAASFWLLGKVSHRIHLKIRRWKSTLQSSGDGFTKVNDRYFWTFANCFVVGHGNTFLFIFLSHTFAYWHYGTSLINIQVAYSLLNLSS